MLPPISTMELVEALTEAFDEEELARLLRSRLGYKLDVMTAPGPLKFRVFGVVEAADRAGWLQQLVELAYRQRPNNRAIAAIYEKAGLAPKADLQQSGVRQIQTNVTSSDFERTFNKLLPSLDFDLWIAEAARVGDQVCWVDVEGIGKGTGFLVGPDTLLTRDFLIDQQLRGRVPSDQVRFRFEYKVLADGTRSEGVVVGLHPTDWLIDHSPHAPGEGENPDVLPTPDQLGYALVRLDRPVGLEPPGRARGGNPRGWISVPSEAPALSLRSPVIIAHYPRGESLKLSIDTEGMMGWNANGTRVRYQVQTSPGSTGAPCFDVNWRLFAIHQLADPKTGQPKMFRQGIPIAAIRARLERLGKADALGGDTP
jgi:hypothetical protein